MGRAARGDGVRACPPVRQVVCLTRPMATPPSAALLAVVVCAVLPVRDVAARTIAGEAFVCATARSARATHGEPPLPTFHPRLGVAVVDRFSRPLADAHHTLDLRKPEAWCAPVRLDDADLL